MCDGGGSVGEMPLCWDVVSCEIILLRFEAFFGVVPHLPFHVKVDNWLLNLTPHDRVVRSDNSKIEVVR